MKKVLFSLILISAIGFKGLAQHEQGNISVGGTFNLSFATDKNESGNVTKKGPKTTDFTLLPSLEYFIGNDMSLGLGIGYTVSTEKDNPDVSYHSYSERMFVLNPYFRKYWSLGNKASIFGQASLLYGFGKDVIKYEYTNATTEYKYDISKFSLGIRPGFQFMASDHLALEASFGFVGYENYSRDTGTENNTSSDAFTFNFDLTTIQFGIRYYIK